MPVALDDDILILVVRRYLISAIPSFRVKLPCVSGTSESMITLHI